VRLVDGVEVLRAASAAGVCTGGAYAAGAAVGVAAAVTVGWPDRSIVLASGFFCCWHPKAVTRANTTSDVVASFTADSLLKRLFAWPKRPGIPAFIGRPGPGTLVLKPETRNRNDE